MAEEKKIREVGSNVWCLANETTDGMTRSYPVACSVLAHRHSKSDGDQYQIRFNDGIFWVRPETLFDSERSAWERYHKQLSTEHEQLVATIRFVESEYAKAACEISPRMDVIPFPPDYWKKG